MAGADGDNRLILDLAGVKFSEAGLNNDEGIPRTVTK